MKATLEFKLPEDQEEFEIASNANKYKYILSELDQLLRRRTKYAPDTQSEEIITTLEDLRDWLRGELEQHRINL